MGCTKLRTKRAGRSRLVAMAMRAEELNERFGIAGVLRFAESSGLVCAQVTTQACRGTLFLHGAHVTDWQPAGQEPVLYLSSASEFAPGKAIRGGVPVCWPWFGARSDGGAGPSHGFARLQEWTVEFVALAPGKREEVAITLSLRPGEESRALGFDHFVVQLGVRFGATLGLSLSVMNTGTEPLRFEEALHTYLAVSDVRKCSLRGLEGAVYRDKTDGMREKRMPVEPFRPESETDRVFPGHEGAAVLRDPGYGRQVRVEKWWSGSTVVWNPWEAAAAKLGDLGAETWPGFLCVETANVAENAITVQPGEAHSMRMELEVSAL